MSPATSPVFCIERERLIKAFTHAVSEQLRLQTAQVAALVSGHGFLFDAQIAKAREDRDNAKQAVELHVLQHKCGLAQFSL